MRPGFKTEKLNGGLNRRAATNDMVTAVVMNAVVGDSTLELNKIYTFVTIQEAEALGITQEYDTENGVFVYGRLRRLFLRNPSITIHCMFVAQAVPLADMADKTKDYLAKLLRDKAGAIVQAMIARNPDYTDEEYEVTIETGMDADSVAAIYKAQELVEFEASRNREVDIFVEGRSFTADVGTALDLRNLVNECPDVSVVVMADPPVSLDYPGYAAVEDFTGMVSKAAVSQNAGEQIEDFNLTDVANGLFITVGLSGGQNITSISENALDQFDEKGYVFAVPVSINGIAGFWINDTQTCAKANSDYAYVENNRSIKKAIKLIKSEIIPRVKSRFLVDENTGRMQPEVAKGFEGLAVEALRPMKSSGDISGGIEALVDPTVNILSSSEIILLVTFIPVAIGRRITLRIGFNNPFKN